jgi:hypothetical protein
MVMSRRQGKHGRVPSMTDDSDSEDLTPFEDMVTGGLTPRTVRLLKERRRERGEGKEEEDGIEHEEGKGEEEEGEGKRNEPRGTRKVVQMDKGKERKGGKEVSGVISFCGSKVGLP